MAININDQFNVNAGKAVDSKYGKTVAGKTVPFVSTTEANAAINIAYRYEGLTVAIDAGSGPVEYWYTSPLADGNLVAKIVMPTLDSYPSEYGTDGVQSTGIWNFVNTSIANAAGRVFNAAPSGGWQIGDIWLVVDGNNNLLEIRQITSNVYGWLPYAPYAVTSFSVFSPEYSVLAPNAGNGNDGDFSWMAALPVSQGAQYGPKPTNIWAEYFQKQSGAWVSFQQLIFTVDPYSNGHTNPTDGEIETNSGNRMALVENSGLVGVYQYYPLQFTRLAIPGVARAVSAEPSGGWSFDDLWFYIDPTSGKLSEIRSVTAPPVTEGGEPTYTAIAEVSTGSAAVNYSTTETNTGATWVDSKPVYQIVMVYPSNSGELGGDTPQTVTVNGNDGSDGQAIIPIETLVSIEGVCNLTSYGIVKINALNSLDNSQTIGLTIATNQDTNVVQWYLNFNSFPTGSSVQSMYIILKYTKLT